MIEVNHICKEFVSAKKYPGLKGAIKGLVSREKVRKLAVDDISFKIVKDSLNGKSHHNCVLCPNTTPIFPAFFLRFLYGSIPLTLQVPLVGVKMPVIILMVVDFPAPLLPI